MGIISLIDTDLAVVNPAMLPESFRHRLLERKIELLEAPEHECKTLACNILALSPRKCVLLSGNTHTERMLRDQGVEVLTYTGDEICLKGSGGPTCLTRPLLR